MEKVLAGAPSISASSVHTVRHTAERGRFAVSENTFEGASPFTTTANVPPWLARAICACDGVTTGYEHFQRLKEKHEIPEDASIEKFARVLATLAGHGILELPGWLAPPPAA